jgi:predicted AlkP superfamily phosphohydrolase/phosphomutase
MSESSTFVLGLDGVPWRFVERWAGSGDLPNLARLVEEGATGPLRSTVPANTPVAWPSIATGAAPDGHGVYEFMRLDSTYGHRAYNSTDVRVPPLWELLSPASVANVPLTYPAPEIDGRVVAGMMTPGPDAEGFTHPPSLADDLADAVPDYEVGLDWKRYYDRPDAFVADLRDLVAARRAMVDHVVDPDDELAFAVFTAPDRLQHLVWDEALFREQYRLFDAVVGDAIERCEAEGRRLFVVSDHGFERLDRLVNVNRLLADEGLLVRREDDGVRRLLSTAGLSKDRVLSALSRVGVTDDWLVDHLPDRVVRSAANRVPGDHGLYDLDPERTAAFLHGLGSVYVNDTDRFDPGCVPPEEVASVERAVTSVLRGLRDPATGDRALDVYEGPERAGPDEAGSFAPDVVVEGREGYTVTPDLAETVFRDPGPKAGDHGPDGVFLAWGPDVAAGVAVEDASVVDVAPTVLHAAGRAVPAHVDGRVLTEVFAEGSDPATRAVERAASTGRATESTATDESEAVRERLRGLGYVD